MSAPQHPLDDVAAVWTESRDDARMREHSHWRGEGRYADDRRWLGIGRATQGQLRRLLRILGRDEHELSGSTVLEWGPGGGSNLVALASFASIYYGADVSGPNLEECERQAKSIGYEEFRPVLLSGAPSKVASAIDQPLDVFVSTAVFQHFPSKEYGLEVLACVAGRMRPGGIGSVQIRYDNGEPKYKPKDGAYAKRYLTATSYRLDEFWQNLLDTGFAPHSITRLRIDTNYATFLFSKED